MWIYNIKLVDREGIFDGKLEYSQETGLITKIRHQKSVSSVIKDDGIDGQGQYLCPGMVDIHVHFRDLNQSHKETLESGMKAATHGGITTVFDMPNKDPIVDNAETFNKLTNKASQISEIDIFNYMLVNKNSISQIAEKDNHIKYWKVVFGGTTNVESENYDIITEFSKLVRDTTFLSIHAEDSNLIKGNLKKFYSTYDNHDIIRSKEVEFKAVEKSLQSINKNNNKSIIYHFAHITNELILEYLLKNKTENLSWEVTPHHLFLNTKNVLDLKEKGFVNPPLRDKFSQETLLKNFLENNIPILATDHAPHTLEEKMNNSLSGFPSLDTVIPVMLTNNIPLWLLVETYSYNPSKLMTLTDRGEISVGKLADLILVNPKNELTVTSDIIQSKAKWSPWEGEKLKGWVSKTWKRGKIVFER